MPNTMLGRIADRAHELMGHSQNEDMRAIEDKRKQVEDFQAAGEPQAQPERMKSFVPSAADKVNNSSRVPGAKLLDYQGNEVDPTTPQGMGATSPKVPVPGALGSLPSYDDGGDVPEDQVAKVHEGEKVLSPEEATAYRQAESEVMNNMPISHGMPSERMTEHDKAHAPLGGQMDTEAPKPDYHLEGTKMDTQNAPLGKPKMNMENGSKFDTGDVPVTESSTGKPSPLVAPAKMKPMPSIETPLQSGATDNPNAPQSGNKVVDAGDPAAGYPVGKGKPAPEEVVKQDKMDAMKSGDLVKLGMANINERMLKVGAGAPEGQIPLPTPTAPSARENVVNQEADLKQKMINAPTEQERFQAEKDLAELKRRTPWGSEGSSHPGALGKIGHALSSVAQGAAMGVAPYVLPSIPGSQANIAQQEAIGERGVEDAQKKDLTAADIGLKKAQTAAATNKPGASDKYDIREIKDTRPGSPTLGQNIIAGVNKTDPTDVQYTGQTAPIKPTPETALADKHDYEQTIAKVHGAGLSTAPDDVPASLDAAVKAGKISQEEANQAAGYREANPPASTKIEISNSEKKTAANIKKAGSYYTYTDADGTHLVTGDKLPDGTDSTPIKDAAVFMNEARSGNIVQESLNKIHEDVHEHPEVFDNATARNIVATTLEQIDRATAGLLVAGTGGQVPLPSGMGDMINTALQNKALDKKTGEAVRNYIADYKAMKDKAIVQQMEMQGGKIGRSSSLALQAIINQIPNGSTPDSKTALRQMDNLQRTQDDLMAKYPSKYQDYNKTKPYVPRNEGGVPVGATNEVLKDGKVIGHVVNGKYVAN